MRETKSIERIVTRRLEVNGKDLIEKFIAEAPNGAQVKVYVAIPGGGDYSNMDLDIEDDFPVHLEYTFSETLRDE